MNPENETIVVKINSEVLDELYPNLASLEVELDADLAAMFKMKIGVSKCDDDGNWTFMDDERLQVWGEVSIEAGFESDVEEVFSGLITHLKPEFNQDVSLCSLEVWGMDRSMLMDRQQVLKNWDNKKDSDIAIEIFDKHHCDYTVQDTEAVHDEEVSTIIQRETDIKFLRKLARRNGFDVFVEGTTAVFAAPDYEAEVQPTLAAHFGDETTLKGLNIEVNALAPSNVSMIGVNRLDRTVEQSDIEATDTVCLGGNDAQSLLDDGPEPALMFSSRTTTTGSPEMLARSQALFDQRQWFVTATGTVDANRYRNILKVRRPVCIKGIGETYSGVYYVTKVTHKFEPSGYTQQISAKRNGLGLTGNEDFAADDGGLLAAL